MRRFLLVVTATVLTASACGGDDQESAGGPTSPSPASPVVTSNPDPSPVASVTPPAVPARAGPRRGRPSTTCVQGWRRPQRDTPPFTDPLGIVRRTTGVDGPLEVVDMRYFEGPESPPSEQGYLLEIQRWYIKLYAKDEPAFQGRFLVEARRFGRGVSAVAPYDTRGFRSPDWIGFQLASEDGQARVYPGLPGTWEGVPYDFVKGGEGLSIPGLPEEVAGCLRGT